MLLEGTGEVFCGSKLIKQLFSRESHHWNNGALNNLGSELWNILYGLTVDDAAFFIQLETGLKGDKYILNSVNE